MVFYHKKQVIFNFRDINKKKGHQPELGKVNWLMTLNEITKGINPLQPFLFFYCISLNKSRMEGTI